MMERGNLNRTRRITLRLTEQEYAKIEAKFKASCCRKLSNYIRKHLFNKPIISTYRNQSLDDLMEETIVLTTELRAIGNNINQIAKKINSAKTITDFKAQYISFEQHREILFDKIDFIGKHTQKIAERWLQS
ncbi:plasmid mobilization protein [Flavobacterium pokkalii]|nr:plasmid mobilization relaxosome protein MobC [Flavobacterium pokkalii]